MEMKKNRPCTRCDRFGKCVSAKGKHPAWDSVIRDWHCFEPAGCLLVRDEQESSEPERKLNE
jgi:hypothetical protein